MLKPKPLDNNKRLEIKFILKIVISNKSPNDTYTIIRTPIEEQSTTVKSPSNCHNWLPEDPNHSNRLIPDSNYNIKIEKTIMLTNDLTGSKLYP